MMKWPHRVAKVTQLERDWGQTHICLSPQALGYIHACQKVQDLWVIVCLKALGVDATARRRAGEAPLPCETFM